MKKSLSVFFVLFMNAALFGQKAQIPWEFEADANLYFMPDGPLFLPIFEADKNHLHLEMRYNYEDVQTISIWGGYGFSGGKKFTYSIIPMGGFVAGLTNGMALGLELEFNIAGLKLYSESEQLFAFQSAEDDFFYSWTDLTYAPVDSFFFGLSGQRTRLYETKSYVQYGFLVGGNLGSLELALYFYNPGTEDFMILLSAAYSF